MTQSAKDITLSVESPKFHWLPKIHKAGTPLCPLYPVGIHYLWGGQKVGQHHLTSGRPVSKSHKEYTAVCRTNKLVWLEPGEVKTFYDVMLLFTSVPMDPTITIVQHRLHQDLLLPHRTSISIPKLIALLELCLKNTYFLFQGKYFEQVHGAALGSSISSLITNLFMEEFEGKDISSTLHLPIYGSGMWLTLLSSNRQNTVISQPNIASTTHWYIG